MWFQLKLFVERAELDGMLQSDDSYENVITSLSVLDQTILRTVVFMLGGLSISEIAALLGSLNRDLLDSDVARSIADMATIGLLIVNGATRDRVRVEHDMVSKVVDNLTPEDDKLELHQSLVSALVDILNNRKSGDDDDALFDRLIGITHEQEVRQNPAIQSHLVRHINRQHELEQYMYVATLCRDSVCWQVLDILPSATVALVLDALQKCSLFSLGLLTTERLKSHENHASLAWLYEGKYLAQLFKYEEALASLQKAEPSSERELVEYTIRLNLHENKELKKLAEEKLKRVETGRYVEFDFFVLRNSGHLFSRSKARKLLELAVTEFEKKKLSYAAATARNNLGIIELDDGNLIEAKALFEQSLRTLEVLGSPEKYQPQVSLGGVAILSSDWDRALTLLSDARNSLPPSLPMDQLMLSHNEAAVLLLSGRLPEVDTISVFSEVSQLASRTRDVRFIEVLSWFVQRLQCLQKGLPEPKVSTVLSEILSSRTARQELFMEFSFLGEKIDGLYILSPHWRH